MKFISTLSPVTCKSKKRLFKNSYPVFIMGLLLLFSFQSIKAQTNPSAFDLSTGSWTLTGWNSGVTAGSYPANGSTGANNTTGVIAGAANANMVFWTFAGTDPSL